MQKDLQRKKKFSGYDDKKRTDENDHHHHGGTKTIKACVKNRLPLLVMLKKMNEPPVLFAF